MAIDGDNSNEVFSNINERPVDDISLEFFYKPHTITLLTVSIAAVIYSAFTRDEQDMQNNIRAGILCVIFFFLIISVLAFPNGPFTRPHPAVWRMVFGMSVLYLLALLFILFQSYKTVKSIILWIDPSLKDFHIDMDKEYGVNCSDVTIERVWSHIDVFAVGHYFGWMFKAILVRHLGILWAISVMWEFTESLVALAGLHGADFIVPFSSCLTEVLTKLNTGCALRGIKPEPHGYEDGQKIAFAHLLPNFIECWWDALILDVLVCNGLGIWCGLKICKYMEMREYKWVSIRDIRTTSGKIKRAVLQFTPGSWMQVRWLDPSCTYMRFFALCQLVIFWQVSELNTFFLKHIFEMPPSHPIVVVRLILIGVFVAPSVRQYYSYVTNPLCKRVGTQCWVYGAIMVTEAILCIKNGKELFERTQAFNIILWLLLQLLTSILCVYGCVLWHRYIQKEDEMSRDSSPCKTPDSGFVDQKSHIDGITSEIIGTIPNRPKFPWDLKRRAVVSRESQTPDTQTRASL